MAGQKCQVNALTLECAPGNREKRFDVVKGGIIGLVMSSCPCVTSGFFEQPRVPSISQRLASFLSRTIYLFSVIDFNTRKSKCFQI
jgi:hypothetical protein